MRFARPTDVGSIGRMVEDLKSAEPSYAEIGATLTGQRPSGYRNDHQEVVLGQGMEIFQRAVRGLQSWQAHRLFGIKVLPEETEIRAGETVVVTLGHVVALAAPCRIICVIDEPNRWGFVYGTLPGHPEEGEEAFIVSISEDGIVRFEITAFSRPANLIVRFSRPVGRGIQKRYLRALHSYVNKEP